MFGKGYGMPSSHSQFVSYFAVSLTLFLLFRHLPSPSSDSVSRSYTERLIISVFACIGAVAVSVSRIYLNYHTTKQVLAGCTAGAFYALLWYFLTAYLRGAGWVDWVLDTELAGLLRLRDLVVSEDLIEIGWRQWEAKRKLKRRDDSDTSHKTE